MFASGCGSLSQPSGGAGIQKTAWGGAKKITKRQSSRTGQVLSGPAQVGVFTGSFNGQTGQLTIQPESASTRATPYGPRHALTLTGTATALPGGVLRGAVTLASTNPVELVDCRAVLLSVSTSGVTASNADGTTDLTGTPRPYWEYGTIRAGMAPLTREWEFQNPGGVSFTFRVAIFANTWTVASADGSTVNACSFINTTTGWAVGSRGKILSTTDGGASWTIQNAGTSADLKDVFFISATRGCAVGAGGMILLTTDGGTTWRHRQAISNDGFSLPVSTPLNAVYFTSALNGVAVGESQTIVRTTDGGNTWQQVATPGTAALYDVDFGDATTGWAVGQSATVLKTTDGGATWSVQAIPSTQWVRAGFPSLNILQAVYFTDAQRGCAVGSNGWVIVTTNGGATWTKKRPLGAVLEQNLTSLFFANATTGWATQQDGGIMRTTDGGETWAVLPNAPTTQLLFGITGLTGNTNRLWVVGQNGFTGYTTDGGATWLRPGQASGATSATTGSDLNALWFHNATRGWAVGKNGVILRTLDSGANWRSAASLAAIGSDLNDVHFANANDGWAVGTKGRIIRTNDGGQNWTALYWSGLEVLNDGRIPTNLYGVRFLDSQRGWIVGGDSTILRTEDGGDNWDSIFPPTSSSFTKIGWLDDQRGWIVGSLGVIIGTSDGGETWDLLFSGTSENLSDIAVVPAGPTGVTIWAVGARGTLLKSTDGVSFEQILLEIPSQTLQSVAFLPNGRDGWIAGNGSLVLRTQDGGDNWTIMDVGVGGNQLLRSIFPVSADEVWLAGQSGTLRVFR